MTLLRIDSSAREGSISRQLTSQFVRAWRLRRPESRIIERNLANTTLPAITDDWIATYGDPSLVTPAQHQYLLVSDELIDEPDARVRDEHRTKSRPGAAGGG